MRTSNSLANIKAQRMQMAEQAGLLLSKEFEDGSVSFIGETPRGPTFCAFIARRSRPVENVRFRNADYRDAFAAAWNEQRAEAVRSTIAFKVERKRMHTLVVGDVLDTCWGFNQTNRDYFQIIAVRGRLVDLRELHQDRTCHGSGDSGTSVPRLNCFKGEVISRRADGNNVVKITSYIIADLWNGKPQSFSTGA